MWARNSVARLEKRFVANVFVTFEPWKREKKVEGCDDGFQQKEEEVLRINENDKHEKFVFTMISLLSHRCKENESVLLLI